MFCAGKRTRLAFIIFAVNCEVPAGLHGNAPEYGNGYAGQIFLTFVVCRN
jgi:hypothetical protein